MIGLIIAVIYGLSTDYEVFLVSRMVEARDRGMSTTEAIRIGTATTGRLITAAALVLAVVAGAFVFSDLVMMKYLAFGLLIALLLDATIVRMFLVPAIMKLLGDDCWWAPKWMKRLQHKIGLGETTLPDERKRPALAVRSPTGDRCAERPGRRPTGTSNRRGQARGGSHRNRSTHQPPMRPPPGSPQPRPRTTATSGPGLVNCAARPRGGAPTPTRRRRNRPPNRPGGVIRTAAEGGPSAQQPIADPSAQPTRVIPHRARPRMRRQRSRRRRNPPIGLPGTVRGSHRSADLGGGDRAIPVSRPESVDSEVATEQLNARGKKGGGVSAQDLLRREGRL